MRTPARWVAEVPVNGVRLKSGERSNANGGEKGRRGAADEVRLKKTGSKAVGQSAKKEFSSPGKVASRTSSEY